MSKLDKVFAGYRPNWDWAGMQGTRACLKWNVRDLYSLDLALRHTKGRKAAIQAGGNLGLFAKRLAEEFRQVFTFEPDKVLFAQLEHNAPEANIVPVCAALGCSRDPVRMECGRRDDSGRAVHEGLTYVAGAGDTPQILIDDLELPALNLIYLDIEGYELNALRGAEKTVARCQPTIAVESNGNARHYGSDKKQLAKWFGLHSYRKVVRIHGDDIYVPLSK